MKKRVYFNEYNLLMGDSIYLPVVSGMLSSFAKKNKLLTENYMFMPYSFIYENSEEIVKKHIEPDVVAFSVSMWNLNLSLEVAKKIKDLYKDCLIVFGGASSPFEAKEFLKENKFIDIVVHGEGEEVFSDILLSRLKDNDFSKINRITFFNGKDYIKNSLNTSLEKELDNFPSPYLDGEFDYLINEKKLKYQVILETNRGCPYNYSFCFWGMGGLDTKYRFFSMERVIETAHWCGKNKIEYIFCADSNFGIHKRDIDVAETFVEVKKKYGYPEKFRVCYAKNSSERVYEICKKFHNNQLDKGATLSFQTVDEGTAKNVGRKNIKLVKYKELLDLYNESNIPVYTELILGLPGETYKSFLNGIDAILDNGIKNQLFIYFCQVYINTDMDKKDYREKFGIKTVKLPLSEIHCSPKSGFDIVEYEEVILETNTMPREIWKKKGQISWLLQLLHGLKLGYFIMSYVRKRFNIKYSEYLNYLIKLSSSNKFNDYIIIKQIQLFNDRLNEMLNSSSKCIITPEYGDIYWDIDELAFLNIMQYDKNLFYVELHNITKEFLSEEKIDYDNLELEEIFLFQNKLMPNLDKNFEETISFNYNIKDYLMNNEELKKNKESLSIESSQNYNSIKEFAKFTILFGRKSDKILKNIKK